jgi:hypothetical protein
MADTSSITVIAAVATDTTTATTTITTTTITSTAAAAKSFLSPALCKQDVLSSGIKLQFLNW